MTGKRMSIKELQASINLQGLKVGAKNPKLAKKRETDTPAKIDQTTTLNRASLSTTSNKRRRRSRKGRVKKLLDDDDDNANTKFDTQLNTLNEEPSTIDTMIDPALLEISNKNKQLAPLSEENVEDLRAEDIQRELIAEIAEEEHKRSNSQEIQATVEKYSNMIKNKRTSKIHRYSTRNSEVRQRRSSAPAKTSISSYSAHKRSASTSLLAQLPELDMDDMEDMKEEPKDEPEEEPFLYVTNRKITIIGHSRVGKTSLKDAINGDEFKDMTFPTQQASVKPVVHREVVNAPRSSILQVNRPKLKMKRRGTASSTAEAETAGVAIDYEFWDTPGQKILESVPPLYITGAFAVFIVYDITDNYSFRRAEYWVNYLQDSAKGYENVVLIGNKCDLESQREVLKETAGKYAAKNDMFFIEISVKTKTNFDKLLQWMNKTSMMQEQNANQQGKKGHGREKSIKLHEVKTKKRKKGCC